jgi:hypothetical protein
MDDYDDIAGEDFVLEGHEDLQRLRVVVAECGEKGGALNSLFSEFAHWLRARSIVVPALRR